MTKAKKIDPKLCAKLNKKLDKASRRIKKIEKKRTILTDKIAKLIITKNKLQKELNAAKGLKPESDLYMETATDWYKEMYEKGNRIWSDEMPPIDRHY